MTIPLLLALVYGEGHCARAFVVSILIALVPGILIRLTTHASLSASKLKLRYSYFIVTASWIIASILGALPYVISGSIPDFIDAVFETASGFTTTGSTILPDMDSLPKSILFWRSLTQWLGGMGIIVLFVALLPDFGIKSRNIAGAETPGPTITKISSRFSGTARMLYMAYVVLTVAEVVFLLFGGMSLYDAVNHALTTMATGGYSTHTAGIAYFDSTYITWVFTVFMFLAGTNFNLFFVAFQSGPRKAFSDEEFRFYAVSVLIAIVLIVINLMTQGGYDSFGQALTDSAFQVVTVITTTGYATVDFSLWPAFSQMLLILLMFTGASSSSTAGGIKEIRVLVFIRMIKYEAKRILHTNIVEDIRYNGKKMLPETLTFILTFITTYIITLIAATFLLSLTGAGNLVTNFTAVLTCISNVGPGLDLVGPVCNFSFYSGFAKILLSLVMIAGRLELSTFMLFFTSYFWRPEKV
ncbi:MAG: TrkH family potassium uptake protein [Mogibacterium sp.]|nr:TrkH family potassium uptake protein [Mogibacterium sp.]